MNLHYHIIQYLDDPISAEGRNVAVIGHDGRRAYFRALGMEERRFLPSLFKALSPKARASVWVYQEWLEWFEYLANNEGANPEMLQLELDRLSLMNGLALGGEGVLENVERYDTDLAMDQLFKRLVKTPSISPALAFEDGIERMLRLSEIYFQNGFMENAEIEMISEGDEAELIKLDFEFVLLNAPRTGFKTLRFKGVAAKTLDRQITKIKTTFEAAIKTGFLNRNRCVVLCDISDSGQQQDYIARLTSIARVVNIFSESAPSDIHHIVHAT